MYSVKSATLDSLAMAKEVVSPEHLCAGLVAAAGKSKELVEAAPGAVEHVSHSPHFCPLFSPALISM